jgi:hypothetical protein
MKQRIEKFLEFKGKTLLFLAKNGIYWVALKPVCEAIGVNYNRQYQNVTSDPILSRLFAIQQMDAKDDRLRKMVCLPEHFIYGWLFSIKSESSELLEYKKECYEILFNYFHGTITNRQDLLREKAIVKIEREQIEKEFSDNEKFIKLGELKAHEARLGKQLKDMDEVEVKTQYALFSLDS